MAEKGWSVSIAIDEHEGKTRAKAQLYADGHSDLVGIGLARLNPTDRDIPAIGDELAVARALADLSHQLIESTAADIENVTKVPPHLEL